MSYPPPPSHDTFRRILNIIASLFLILLTSPFWMVIPVLIKLSCPGPILYRGTRLGLHKRPFTMYKFRTLKPDAEQIIGATLITERNQLETPIGGFLRDTRLDELPQLINVIKGDMNLIGPRPERPAIYEHLCKQISGYDGRFTVRPGVIGFAQLFTPHSSPKRLRSLIDNYYSKRKQGLWYDLQLFVCAIGLIAIKALRICREILVSTINRLRGRNTERERRELRRIRLSGAKVYLRPFNSVPDSPETSCNLVDINKEAILIRCNDDWPLMDYHLRLERYISNRLRRSGKRRIVYCEGKATIKRPSPTGSHGYDYVLVVEPTTPLNDFKYEKYFLMASIS
jgi:lipopolysaccharide/colanic/teichoic acid biosynthesis glycosyltransferase